jgi:curved DNA-binding protein CbpA
VIAAAAPPRILTVLARHRHCSRHRVSQIPDYYEILQISPSAEPETVHRVYRLLAQRFHPDNAETGNDTRFRALAEAYHVLSNPEERARYDVMYASVRQERWRLLSGNQQVATDLESEHLMRLTLLELLYARRRTERDNPGLSLLDLEAVTGRAREHLEFTIWYLVQKKYVSRSDGAVLSITIDGVDYIEEHLRSANARRRLAAGAA